MKYIDETVEVYATNTFLTVLWVLFLFPLYLVFSNAFASDIPEEIYQELPVMELPVTEEIETEVVPEKVEEVKETSIRLTDITIIENEGFIWEQENTFGQAFRIARSLLGSDETFIWHGKLYHTNFLEEISLLTTKEQEFLQVPGGERE
jgi:ABC-type glycerol-3-phosphate transport system permease component